MYQEPFGKESTEKLCAAVPGPLGDDIAEFEKAKLFMAKFYKVMTLISNNHEKSRTVTTIFDTVADRILIRENAILTLWLEKVLSIQANLRVAEDKTFIL